MVLCKIKDFFNSGSNVSMIQRSALPKGIFTKFLGDTKLARTLAGHLKMHKVVTMRDQQLPKFDKTGASNLLLVLVFDNDNVKNNFILSTNLLSKTGFKSNCSEGNMEWFDQSIPLRPPGGLEFERIHRHGTHVAHPSQKQDLW